MNNRHEFFKYVIPAVIAFALSGIYSIVDGFFVGNTIGDDGLSAVNIAYPVVALMSAVGTGIGMGGAVHYSIHKAQGEEAKANQYVSLGWWMMLISSVILTIVVYAFADSILRLLGAQNNILVLADEYIKYIAIGTIFQVLGTGIIPYIRNYGGSVCAMTSMMFGFGINIVLDYLFVWVMGLGMCGAAVATNIGQFATAAIAIGYELYKRKFFLRVSVEHALEVCKGIIRVGIAPFGLTLTPNISLLLVNRFSAEYGGDHAVATYACIAYVICVIYLILQGVGDGSQPLMSKYYGENNIKVLNHVRLMSYGFALALAIIGMLLMFITRGFIGTVFGTSAAVNAEITRIMPIFLISVPFVAVTRIATASFYATENAILSYILTFIEPILLFALLLTLPRIGGQMMIWWSTVLARILAAILAAVLTWRSHTAHS